MTILAVIPVRQGATRLPGKPLADLDGRPVVQWVYEAARACPCVRRRDRRPPTATRSPAAVRAFGGAVELTARRPSAPAPTASAEVAERHPEADVVVNVQGDQPFATPEMLAALVAPYVAGETPAMTTLASPARGPGAARRPQHREGRLRRARRRALLLAQPDPAPARRRRRSCCTTSASTRSPARRCCAYPRCEPTPLERLERLEQLRALEHGVRIRVCLADRPVLEINTPEDLERARALVGGAVRQVEVADGVTAGDGPAAAADRRAVRRSRTRRSRVRMAEAIRARSPSATACGFVFKSSFDKANRSSAASARGPGMEEGLRRSRRA